MSLEVFNPNLNEVSHREFVKGSRVLSLTPSEPEPRPTDFSLLNVALLVALIDWTYNKYSELIYNKTALFFFLYTRLFSQ